ncbi:unnamed protein product [Ectocarpus sp. CCAP 1310/34]|nr:unnamed protein product [Ectocarpus sp. CCAP 1310/34]
MSSNQLNTPSFPDDFASPDSATFVGPQGPVPDGVRLADVTTEDESEPVDADSEIDPAVIAPLLADFPFAACASLDELTPPRRSGRRRTPSVRQQPLNDPQLPTVAQVLSTRLQRAFAPEPIELPPAHPPEPVQPECTRSADVEEVLSAGGELPFRSAVDTGSTAIHRTLRVLKNPDTLIRRQQDDALVGQVRQDP